MAKALGLNSGSSFDGVDVVLIEIQTAEDGHPARPTFKAGKSFDWPASVADQVLKSFENEVSVFDLCRLNYLAGAVYAECARTMMREHDEGRLRRGGDARRPPEAVEPLLDLRRQRHHHRGQETSLAFSEDVGRRFEAYGWNVIRVGDANDFTSLGAAFRRFRDTDDRPTMIIVKSHIGYGSPNKQDTYGAHGAPLGEEEVRLTKRAYGWPEDAKFLVPDEVTAHFRDGIGKRGHDLRTAWDATFEAYAAKFPDLADQLNRMQKRTLPDGWDADIPTFPADDKGIAGRIASGKVLNAIAARVPWLLGGAADLAPSTNTRLTFAGAGDLSADDYAGRNFHFGVREHAMGSILNGMSLSKLRAYGSGFLIFSDYARAAIRLSALMEIPTIHIFTHDSIGVGEDGPTHQPVEQLASLRAIPGLIVLRPADANEVAEAWRVIMQLRHEAVVLVLTRQNLPTLDRTRYAPAAGVAKGAYVLADTSGGKPDVILMATGSEVSMCVAAYEQLKAEGVAARVVSMPSWELFEYQDQAYRDSVLPPEVTARVAVEKASVLGWTHYTGLEGHIIGMRCFGASAPLRELQRRFGFVPENVVTVAKELAETARV